MDERTKKWLRHVVALHRGDTERAAQWMVRSLGVRGIREVRRLIQQAVSEAQ